MSDRPLKLNLSKEWYRSKLALERDEDIGAGVPDMEYMNEITLTPLQVEGILKEHFQKALAKMEPPGRVLTVVFEVKSEQKGDQREPITHTYLSGVKVRTTIVV